MQRRQPLLWNASSLVSLAALAVLLGGVSSSATAAEEFNRLEDFVAQVYAQHFVEKMGEVEGQQIVVEADAELARGLAEGDEGLILVPVKDLKEDEINPDVNTEKGGSLAYLFMSPRFNPIVEGKAVAQDQLHTITFMDESGEEKEATCLILAVRRVDEENWRLYAYGKAAEPLVDSQFKESYEEADSPVAISASSKGEKENTLVVTVFGKYAASFEIGK
ncbi:MAG: hypothetical protein KDA57_01810 [Planctomycetales bacterium]|nr:hypothetical protein [Planctomycetales bacterium]